MQNSTEIETNSQLKERAKEKLKRDCGEYLPIIEDPNLIEIMRNPSGEVFTEYFGSPMQFHSFMPSYRAEAILKVVAGFFDKEVTKKTPILECEWPLDGSRFSGCLPPIVASPTFALRKKAQKIFTLDDYVCNHIITPQQKEIICQNVFDHKNILVIGGTGSGKTTLVNAIIKEITDQFPEERIVIIEDTGEIQCSAKNHVQLHTTLQVTMTDLLKMTLRFRPDRILVGEVRGAEALDLLDAWNTGHEGGVATLHANNSESGLTRLKSLITRNPAAPKEIEPLIGEAVHCIVQISKQKENRKVTGILQVKGFQGGHYLL